MVSPAASILVVDDEETVCRLLCDDLGSQGFWCVTASTGNEALTRLATETFDLALLDIRLPDISGIEVLRVIQSNCYMIAVIMVTAVNDIETAVESMKLGAADYVVKPFNLEELGRIVRRVLECNTSPFHVRSWQKSARVSLVTLHKARFNGSFRHIDAIAEGVRARLDGESHHTRTLIERTADIAYGMGIDETDIGEWVTARLNIYEKEQEQLKHLLEKLRRNQLARLWLGLTRLEDQENNSN